MFIMLSLCIKKMLCLLIFFKSTFASFRSILKLLVYKSNFLIGLFWVFYLCWYLLMESFLSLYLVTGCCIWKILISAYKVYFAEFSCYAIFYSIILIFPSNNRITCIQKWFYQLLFNYFTSNFFSFM